MMQVTEKQQPTNEIDIFLTVNTSSLMPLSTIPQIFIGNDISFGEIYTYIVENSFHDNSRNFWE